MCRPMWHASIFNSIVWHRFHFVEKWFLWVPEKIPVIESQPVTHSYEQHLFSCNRHCDTHNIQCHFIRYSKPRTMKFFFSLRIIWGACRKIVWKNGNLHKIDQNNTYLPIFLQLAWHHSSFFFSMRDIVRWIQLNFNSVEISEELSE